MGNAIIPLRASDETTLPLRWRIYVLLQKRGAALNFVHLSHNAIAALLDCSPMTVCRQLKWLVGAGYLEARAQSGRHGGRLQAYRVVIDEGPAAA